MAAKYFEYVKQKEFDQVLPLYSQRFFKDTSSTEWLQILKNVNAKLGDLQSYSLKTWKTESRMGTGDSGTYYILQYEVTYSRYAATETITFFKPAAGGELKILGHNINSKGLVLQ